MSIGILGKKIGMTRVYDEKGKIRPVTVIDARDNTVLQVKSVETDGYAAVQVGYGSQKESRLTKAALGHVKKAGSEPKRFIREFRLKEGESAEFTGLGAFAVGQKVDVIGTSKGKGFQGVVRRFKFQGQPASHGSMMHRRNGAIGNRSTPGRVWKNMGMPGHMGDDRITTQNLTVVQIREEDQLILVEGSVPGANGSFVIVRPAIKAVAKKEA